MKAFAKKPRILISTAVLLALLLLHMAGFAVYNVFFRYEFTPVFIGLRASFAWDEGQRVALVLNEGRYLQNHLFELPNAYKRLLAIPCASIEDRIETDEHGHIFIGYNGDIPKCAEPGE